MDRPVRAAPMSPGGAELAAGLAHIHGRDPRRPQSEIAIGEARRAPRAGHVNQTRRLRAQGRFELKTAARAARAPLTRTASLGPERP
jgi:hypothetical protein